eukprot:scaffold16597_cov146-Isochrysis_galbana.AAC.1
MRHVHVCAYGELRRCALFCLLGVSRGDRGWPHCMPCPWPRAEADMADTELSYMSMLAVAAS